MASKRQGKKKGRLSIRLRDEQFVVDVHAFAARHNTNVTALVESHLVRLLEEERGIMELEQG